MQENEWVNERAQDGKAESSAEVQHFGSSKIHYERNVEIIIKLQSKFRNWVNVGFRNSEWIATMAPSALFALCKAREKWAQNVRNAKQEIIIDHR